MVTVRSFGVDIRVDAMPCEIPSAVRFDADREVRPYDGDVARTYWRALLQVQRVFHLFRTRFVGKCSPIHLFWGSFDLALTRFSGRPAPRHPGGAPHMRDSVARDAYSQEVSSAGFWPGQWPHRGPVLLQLRLSHSGRVRSQGGTARGGVLRRALANSCSSTTPCGRAQTRRRHFCRSYRAHTRRPRPRALESRASRESVRRTGFPPEEKIGRTTTHS